MGIFDTIMGLFPPATPQDQEALRQQGQAYLNNPLGNAPQYDYANTQRDLANLYWSLQDLSGVGAYGLAGERMPDVIGAIQHIFGNDINAAATALNYGTSGPDAQFNPNFQPGTPDVMLGPSGPVQTGGQNPYATQANYQQGQQKGTPTLQNQQTPEFAAPGQWAGTVQMPIAGQGMSTVQPQGPGGAGGYYPPAAANEAGAKGGGGAAKSKGAAGSEAQQGAAAPQPQQSKQQAAPQADPQQIIQIALSRGQYTDPQTGQVIDFSQMPPEQVLAFLQSVVAQGTPQGGSPAGAQSDQTLSLP